MDTLYIFNPTCEMAIANGLGSYQPPSHLQKFEIDLASLPMFFSQTNDAILAPPPPKDFLKLWENKISLPHFITNDQIKQTSAFTFKNIQPWGWTPALLLRIKNLIIACPESFQHKPMLSWNQNHPHLFSRKSLLSIQDNFRNINTNPFLDIPYNNKAITSFEEAIDYINKNNPVIFKLPLAASGRGLHSVKNLNIDQVSKRWIEGAIKKQDWLMGEPFLNKQLDFSFQLFIHPDGKIDYLGNSYFQNDLKGHFTGGYIHWKNQITDDRIKEFCSPSLFQNAAQQLIEAIQKLSPHKYYHGPIGVDAIVFSDDNNCLKLHPCLDINWRYNMGNINLIINKLCSNSSYGKWHIKPFKDDGWQTYARTNLKNNPPVWNKSKLTKGFLPLIPFDGHKTFGAWLELFTK